MNAVLFLALAELAAEDSARYAEGRRWESWMAAAPVPPPAPEECLPGNGTGGTF